MTTWLLDTALFKSFPSDNHLKALLKGDDASLFLSAASLAEFNRAIARTPESQARRRDALQAWLEDLKTRFEDRIHSVDVEVALRAGKRLQGVKAGHPRHHFHDALLVATAELHGHGLVTRRDGVFGGWTPVPVVVV